MADMKEKPNVNTPSLAYKRMATYRALPRALMGGTQAMRAAGQTFLPDFEKESSGAYNKRLSQSVLFNGYGHTMKILSARPFSRPVTVEGPDAKYLDDEGWLRDMDLTGRDITEFSRDLLRDMLTPGMCHFSVEYPNTDEKEAELERRLTLADKRVENIRPYFNRIDPDNVIEGRGERIMGIEALERARVREQQHPLAGRTGDAQWHETTVNLVRAYYPDRVDIWEERKTQGGKAEWMLTREGIGNSLGRVPLVVAYAQREDFYEAYPPMEGLADLNLKHWQSQSDQDNILHAVRAAILYFAGFSASDVNSVEIGPWRAIFNKAPQARVEYVEHSGTGIKAGAEDLDRIKQEMATMGADLLVRRPGNQTATASIIDAGESISDLQAMVIALERALEEGFRMAGEWEGKKDLDIEVKINQDFGWSAQLERELAELREDFDRGVITRKTYLKERKRRGLYSDDLNIEEEMEATEFERPFTPNLVDEEEGTEEFEEAA